MVRAQVFFKFLLVVITFSIFSNAEVSAKRKPNWVKQRPTDPSYYMGRAMSFKKDGEVSYRINTKNKALKELSSQIKVNISSNSILRQFESNYEVKEEFESSTYESIDATLEGYEVLTWENKKEYWVLVRLSKDKYEMRKQMKLDNAKKISATYYYEAQEAVEKGSIYQGILLYIKAIGAIKSHVSEDLTYRDVDGTINLGTAIFSGIQDAFKMVNLEADQAQYLLQFSKELKVPLSLHAFYIDQLGEKRPLVNIPLTSYFSKGEGELSLPTTSDRDGLATFEINRLISKRKRQEIVAEFNIAPLIEKEDEETKVLLRAFFHKELLPKTTFSIEVEKSSAYVEANEIALGVSTDLFTRSIRSELSSSFFNITQDKETADFIVKVKAEFVEGGERKGSGYSLFIVFADVHISVIDNQTKMEIFSEGFSGLRGMKPGSYEYALKDVRAKALEKVKSDILLDMEQVNL